MYFQGRYIWFITLDILIQSDSLVLWFVNKQTINKLIVWTTIDSICNTDKSITACVRSRDDSLCLINLTTSLLRKQKWIQDFAGDVNLRGVLTYYLTYFCWKLWKRKKIGLRRGHASLAAPLLPLDQQCIKITEWRLVCHLWKRHGSVLQKVIKCSEIGQSCSTITVKWKRAEILKWRI